MKRKKHVTKSYKRKDQDLTISKKLKDLGQVAEKILQTLSTNQINILLLNGTLGAGKTTLTKEIGKKLGVDPSEIISPTFVILREHQIPKGHSSSHEWNTLVHIDAYRLTDEEGQYLDLPKIFGQKENLVIIEWPEMISQIITLPFVSVTIDFNISEEKGSHENSRVYTITVNKHGTANN